MPGPNIRSPRAISKAETRQDDECEQQTSGAPTSLEAEISAEPSRTRKFFKVLGPGLITGASDDDPSGIGTYSIAGAAFGYATLWMTLVMLPLMAAIQFICAKIGMVSGEGLTGVLRRHYPRWLLYPTVIALFVACTINAGADIGAIAAGINLLVPVPVVAMVVPIGVGILVLQVIGSYELIVRVFKWLTLALFAYIFAALLARPNALEVLRGTFVPRIELNATYLAVIVALLGTTISPYLFFWQSDMEVEEQIRRGRCRLWQRKGASDTELQYKAVNVNTGMVLSELVAYFIIFATAATLHQAGKTDIRSATDAAQALRPIAGAACTVLLAFGLVGAGFLAVPILTGAGAYALSEAFGWRFGLERAPRHAPLFYGAIAVSTVVGMLINYMGINPIDALLWTAVINGFLAPPIMVLIMLISNNHAIMAGRTNGFVTNAVGWAATAAMFAAAAGLVVTSLKG